MVEKEIAMLNEQIAKLDDKGFDLDAWKIFTISIVERIFGAGSHKIEQLKDLKYDFSSWSLRDTSGSSGSIKKKSRVILEAAISELENFGLPNQKDKNINDANNNFLEVFENELKGFQFKKLKEILKIDDKEEKTKQLNDLFDDFDNDEIKTLLVQLLAEIR